MAATAKGHDMQRVSREHTVPVHKRYQVREPVAEVALGESFVVETINFRTPIVRTPADANPAEYREREETGPIFVKGIEAGDVLAIHVEEIQPVGHASGGWWDDPQVNSFLPIEGERVHFPGGLWAPTRMMIGDIYVTPAGTVGGNPWDNGGNMDFNDVGPGNTLCLRAELDGGLLVLGDVHACQGDGEVLGLGAECAADVQIRITRDERFLPERPLVVRDDAFVAIACRRPYHAARDLAARDAAKLLARITGVTENEAFLFATTVGSLRNGAVWPMGKTSPSGEPNTIPLVVGLEVPLYDWGLARPA